MVKNKTKKLLRKRNKNPSSKKTRKMFELAMIEMMNAALLNSSKGDISFLSLFSWIGSFGYEKGNFSCAWATETENRSYTFLVFNANNLPSLKRTITTLTSFFLLLQEPKTPIATATSCSWI